MNKKGFLLAEQVVKIVIALIGLSFLIYFLSSLYFNKINLENQEKAEDYLSRSINSIKIFISNNLSQGQTEFFNPNIPNGWYLFSFTGNSEKPIRCEGKNCLCICESVYLWGQLDKCNEEGSCLIVENLKNYEDELEIKLTINPSVTLVINKTDDKIGIIKK